MPRRLKDNDKAEVHDDLKGFNIQIDSFGEILSNLPIEELNTFLNKNKEDKKLTQSTDLSNQTEEE